MKKYKPAYLLSGLVFSLLFLKSAFSDELECSLKNLPAELKLTNCRNENGTYLIKLLPTNSPSTTSDLDRLPTFIVRGKTKRDALSKLGLGNATPYNTLIQLPAPESIIQFYAAPASAKSKLLQKNWTLLDMKIVIYKGVQDMDGYSLVCSTLQRDATGGITLVSQCNDFYENDISKLKELLISLEN